MVVNGTLCLRGNGMSKLASDDYWDRFTHLQQFKHELLRRYLNAWFPILSRTGARRIVYIETHAGRGRHESGHAGSPLVAIQTLVEHRDLPNILRSTEVVFALIEAHPENAKALQSEVAKVGALPKGVVVEVVADLYQGYLRQQLEEMKRTRECLAPAFVFVDPFSFLIDSSLLANLMSHQRCEILLNFMWENARQAIGNEVHAANMDGLFGEGSWRDLRSIEDEKSRCDEAAVRLKARVGARFHRVLRCYGSRNSIKYVLAHFTNNELGYEKMNEAMWAVDPGGTFAVSQQEDPRTDWIFAPQASIDPLKARLLAQFLGQTVRYEQLWRLAREVYLKKHLRQAVMELIQEGRASLPGSTKLVVKDNPLVRIS